MEDERKGVKKGTWTKDEDILLRKCINKYGEGKWHLVPLRAGLNRCRKSCRLRWLNYLKPSLKRGHFNNDEVDLIIRLHKLLGNRWSLIAGRLPRRTANDVKNFWNTHVDRKPRGATAARYRSIDKATEKTITRSNIIRPRPWNFSKSSQVPKEPPNNGNSDHNEDPSSKQHRKDGGDDGNPENYDKPSSQEAIDECMKWWIDLLETTDGIGEVGTIPVSDGDRRGMEVPVLSRPGLCEEDNHSDIN